MLNTWQTESLYCDQENRATYRSLNIHLPDKNIWKRLKKVRINKKIHSKTVLSKLTKKMIFIPAYESGKEFLTLEDLHNLSSLFDKKEINFILGIDNSNNM